MKKCSPKSAPGRTRNSLNLSILRCNRVFGHYGVNFNAKHRHTVRLLVSILISRKGSEQFEVRGDSLNANYSHKYPGKSKAPSAHSFIDERHLLFHTLVVSAAERESAWVIDGLMHNDVIKSDIHSTDTHGYTEAIFDVMHLLGFSYAPRIKSFKRQKLYLFKSRKDVDRSSWAVTPSGYNNAELIDKHWDDILRFVTTNKLKEISASDLFRRLNSYSKEHALYTAHQPPRRIRFFRRKPPRFLRDQAPKNPQHSSRVILGKEIGLYHCIYAVCENCYGTFATFGEACPDRIQMNVGAGP